MKSVTLPRLFLFLSFAILSPGRISASTVIIPSDEEMVIGSRAIVRGTVLSTMSGYDPRYKSVFTYTILRLTQVLKGEIVADAAGEIVIKEPGGITGNIGSEIYGIPIFKSGEDVLLYLDTWPDGSLRVYQWFLGKYLITVNPLTGRELITRESADPRVSILGRSKLGPSTDQSDLAAFIGNTTALIRSLALRSALHEDRYYRDIQVRATPGEFAELRKTATPQFTIFNPYQPQRWFEADEGRPVTFSLNPAQMPNSRIIEDIRASMAIWSGVSNTSISLILEDTPTATCGLSSTDGVNTISFNNCDGYSSFAPSVNGGCSGVLAATGISNFDTTQRKTIGGIVFYRAVEGNISFNPFASCYLNDPCNVREIATHELGHAIGLGHSRDTDASMYTYAHFDGRCGTLRSDDETGVRFLYPKVTRVPLPKIDTTALTAAMVGTPYDFELTASGGVPPYRWQLAGGSLPDGILLLDNGFLRGTPIMPGTNPVTLQVTDAANQSVQVRLVLTVSARPTEPNPETTPLAGLKFFPLDQPVRWFDTRSQVGACRTSRTPINVISPMKVSLVGNCLSARIPAVAEAVVGQITVINLSRSTGTYQIVPAGVAASTTGLLTYNPLQTVTTTFISTLSRSGEVEIYSTSQIHVIIDVVGYFGPPDAAGLYFYPLPRPLRINDTTGTPGACTSYVNPIGTGATHAEKATISCQGITIPSSARFIVGNATVTNTSPTTANTSLNNGFVTFYSTRIPRPGTVNIQLPVTTTVAGQVFVALGKDGFFNTYSSASTHISFDIMGYFSAEPEVDVDSDGNNDVGLLFYPLTRTVRLMETRLSEQGCFSLERPLSANQGIPVAARGNCNGLLVPGTARAVSGQITVFNQSRMNGSLVLYPDGQARPATSNAFFNVNGQISNTFTVRLGGTGSFRVEAANLVNLYIDLTGFFAP
ncbi:MAG: hypothetical protein EBZ36_05325 [Acidobacteria bacterium]|nr:hypothetical protein [Acidobacteriota bacterium]